MTEDFTHTTEEGTIDMVDIGDKPDTHRRAIAEGTITLREETCTAIQNNAIEKGDVLTSARIGAIQAVKHTWEVIPLCHQIPITDIDTTFDVNENSVILTVGVETIGKTGCEMEAIYGVSTGLAVIWDMVKSIEKDAQGNYPTTAITDIQILTKEKKTLNGGE
ncbi:MAG: cyclic pyranopterin monophosphate synthase MoaC [Halobacteriaceae archaeon]